MNNCPFDCFQIGGPWIDVNPNCPYHGLDKLSPEDILLARVERLEEKVAKLTVELAKLNKAKPNRKG